MDARCVSNSAKIPRFSTCNRRSKNSRRNETNSLQEKDTKPECAQVKAPRETIDIAVALPDNLADSGTHCLHMLLQHTFRRHLHNDLRSFASLIDGETGACIK